MNNVKRYDLERSATLSGESTTMVEETSGLWVRYEDYLQLAARCEEDARQLTDERDLWLQQFEHTLRDMESMERRREEYRRRMDLAIGDSRERRDTGEPSRSDFEEVLALHKARSSAEHAVTAMARASKAVEAERDEAILQRMYDIACYEDLSATQIRDRFKICYPEHFERLYGGTCTCKVHFVSAADLQGHTCQ